MLWLFQLCYCLLLKAFNLERACKLVYSIGRHYFVSSDSILAFDKFYVQIMHGSFNYGDLFVSSISYRKRNFEFKLKK
jgi:hypothetical protein